MINITDITGIDVKSLIKETLSFYNEKSGQIFRYYLGDLESFDQDVFKTLDVLIDRFNQLIKIIQEKKHLMNTALLWNECLAVDKALLTLSSLKIAKKWTRSSINTTYKNGNTLFQYKTKQNETLFQIAQKVGNSQLTWIDIALQNSLEEEQHSLKGGLLLKLPGVIKGKSFAINSIVGPFYSNEDFQGRDVNARMSFKDDDLDIVSKEECVKQSLQTLISLKRGDHPFYSNDGSNFFPSDLISLNTSVLLRQIIETIKTDDTFVSFKFLSINIVGDVLTIEGLAKTWFNQDIYNKFLLSL